MPEAQTPHALSREQIVGRVREVCRLRDTNPQPWIWSRLTTPFYERLLGLSAQGLLLGDPTHTVFAVIRTRDDTPRLPACAWSISDLRDTTKMCPGVVFAADICDGPTQIETARSAVEAALARLDPDDPDTFITNVYDQTVRPLLAYMGLIGFNGVDYHTLSQDVW